MLGCGGFAAPALAIPDFSEAALPKYSGDELHQQKMAGCAISLAERRLLKRSDCEEGLDKAVAASLSKWLEQLFSGLKFFQFGASVFSDVFEACGQTKEELCSAIGKDRLTRAFKDACNADVDAPHIAIGINSAEREWILVGNGVERLEAQFEGLGWAALTEVGRVGIHYDLFDFSWLEQAASYAYWCGGEDEKEWLEQCGEDPENYQGVTRETFEESIPLRRMLKAPKLTSKRLLEIAESGTGEAAEVARIIVQVRRLKNTPPICRMAELSQELDWFDSLDPTAILGWKDWAVVNQLADDYSEIMYSGDSSLRDFTAILAIPLGSGKALAELEMGLRGSLKSLRLADKLLGFIANKEA